MDVVSKPTFAELAYKPDGTSGLNFGLKPSTSNSIEAGAKTFPQRQYAP